MPINAEEINKITNEYSSGFRDSELNFCQTRDVFSARLDAYIHETSKYLESAIIGEIGNNTFDHNLNYREGVRRGVYFNHDDDDFIIMADYGSGILATLSRVLPDLDSDIVAVKTAFTKIVSGRSPEQRGNGLKFVRSNVIDHNWSLYFQSGNGVCSIADGKALFSVADFSVSGFISILDLSISTKEVLK